MQATETARLAKVQKREERLAAKTAIAKKSSKKKPSKTVVA